MAKGVTHLVRKLFGKHDLHLRLRRAVQQSKPRQIATLLEEGASPVWTSDKPRKHELNALLLACQQGDAHILNLLLDSFFHQQEALAVWGPRMYCMVIRSGHWKAFLQLHKRNVPKVPTHDSAHTIPSPIFVAAENGQHQILTFLIRQNPLEWRNYEFNGHSLLSIASKYGHYECVEVLLANMLATGEKMDFAIDCARKYHQAHVLVLLTSCLPEYSSHSQDMYKPNSRSSLSSSFGEFSRPLRGHHRGSLAETEDSDDNDLERRSSTWMFSDEKESLYGMPFSNESDEAAYQRYNPNRQTMDGFGLLQAARDAEARKKAQATGLRHSDDNIGFQRQSSSGELTWDSSSPPDSLDEDARWYAMNPAEEIIHPYIKSNTSSNSEGDPFSDFDGTFHTMEQHPPPAKVKTQEYTRETSYVPPPPAPQPLLIQTPPVSNKVISIRSQNFRNFQTLPSIKEERQTLLGGTDL
uniref:Uncharacterized protein n=1 Tax=Globisporangium ultimum (strain ATCC 200006 / CBS 805.95 / DAOM BR144) TaxID=431595 RepID=K3XAB0_GLOUD